ncbi:hypothetical protein [Aquamicrobium sp. LC103]|uniref:hypothetical protein n=1 Tax=Aquamicrobium sp. LC103 TaxID=1120658 RepID=UPI000A9A5CC4|nr:hypothetical protein [Aquamicrobium sp. LC103]TKT75412.1 hypothetical protein XW59_020010 [Aquamicrobium sp. LC103]
MTHLLTQGCQEVSAIFRPGSIRRGTRLAMIFSMRTVMLRLAIDELETTLGKEAAVACRNGGGFGLFV